MMSVIQIQFFLHLECELHVFHLEYNCIVKMFDYINCSKVAQITFCVKRRIANKNSRIYRVAKFCNTLSTQFNRSYFQKWMFQEIEKTNYKTQKKPLMSDNASVNFARFVCIGYLIREKYMGNQQLLQPRKSTCLFKGTVMHIEKTLINGRLRVSKVS